MSFLDPATNDVRMHGQRRVDVGGAAFRHADNEEVWKTPQLVPLALDVRISPETRQTFHPAGISVVLQKC